MKKRTEYALAILRAAALLLLLISTAISAVSAVPAYSFNMGLAENITLNTGTYYITPNTSSALLPVNLTMPAGETARAYDIAVELQTGKTSALTLNDTTDWIKAENGNKFALTSSTLDEINGISKNVFNIIINTTSLTANTEYTLEMAIDTAWKVNTGTAWQKNTQEKIYKIKIATPTPTPAPTEADDDSDPIVTPTPSATPAPTPSAEPTKTVTPTPSVTSAPTPSAEPTTVEPDHESGEEPPAYAVPIALIAAAIAALIGCILLLLPLLFPRVTLNYNGQEIKFRPRIGKIIKTAITKHDSELPVDCWYLNEAKTEPWNPDARIWRKVKLWHRR